MKKLTSISSYGLAFIMLVGQPALGTSLVTPGFVLCINKAGKSRVVTACKKNEVTIPIALTAGSPCILPGGNTGVVAEYSLEGDPTIVRTCAISVEGDYIDLGSTVIDTVSGLEWEKKTLDGGIHDRNNAYTWSKDEEWNPDGTAFTVFLATLNGKVPPQCTSNNGVNVDCKLPPSGCFANHCDWRLPEVDEMNDIVLAPEPCGVSPCIDPIFGPTVAGGYFTATVDAENPADVWPTYFAPKPFPELYKLTNASVRAVRGGRR